MKKYLYITRTTIQENIQYLGNFFGGYFVFALIIFVFLQLWNFIYGDKSTVISGYTVNQIIWYVIITEVVWFSYRTDVLRWELKQDIKTGKIAYILNKPYNYILYLLSKHLGILLPNLFMYSIFAVIVGIIYVGPLQTFNLLSIPFILITIILSIFVLALIYILIGISSFWIEENQPFMWVFEKMILVLGITFPIEFFPSSLALIVKLSPIYSVTYGPAKMIIDFNIVDFIEITIFQIMYIVITSLLITVVYKKGVRRINVNGG